MPLRHMVHYHFAVLRGANADSNEIFVGFTVDPRLLSERLLVKLRYLGLSCRSLL
jgi:hypothetical protein